MVTVTVTYETVDVDLEVTTTEVTVEVFAHGEQGKSAYQSYVDTTEDDPVLSEAAWSASRELSLGGNGDADSGKGAQFGLNGELVAKRFEMVWPEDEAYAQHGVEHTPFFFWRTVESGANIGASFRIVYPTHTSASDDFVVTFPAGSYTVAKADHTHDGVYQPVISAYSTISALSGYPASFPTTAANISDSSAVGRSALTAADQKALAAVIGCPRVIYHSAVKVSRPADVSTATLATVEIPANSLGPNGWLEVRLLVTGLNTSAVGTRTVSILFGGVTVKTGGPAASQNFFMSQDILICNRNAANSQIVSSRVDRPDFIWGYFTGLGSGGDAGSMALAVDTTVAQNLVISHQSIASGDTCYLQFLQVIAHYAP